MCFTLLEYQFVVLFDRCLKTKYRPYHLGEKSQNWYINYVCTLYDKRAIPNAFEYERSRAYVETCSQFCTFLLSDY